MKVVAYCRYSSDNQRDGYSIEAQIRAIKDFCGKEGHELVNIYVDEAKSGTSDNREAFQSMIEDASKRRFDAVVVHKLDRFARDRYDSAIYKKKLKDNGVKLISVLEPLDDSPESIMMESVLEGMAEYYSRNLSREIKKGKDELARLGRWNGGIPPFGFDIVDKKYVINEDEAKVVKQIFDMHLAGYSGERISKWLYDNGYKTRRGKWFSSSSVRDLLKNKIYTGVLSYSKKRIETVVCDPIIDASTFERAQEIFKIRKRGPVRKTKQSTYLLTGYLFCMRCGYGLRGYKATTRYITKDGRKREYITRAYRCAMTHDMANYRLREKGIEKCKLKRFNKVKLENFVVDSIHKYIFSDEGINYILKKIAERKKVSSGSHEILAKIKRLEKKKDRLLDLYVDGGVSKDTYNKKNDLIQSQIDEMKGKEIKDYNFLDDAERVKELINKFLDSNASRSVEYMQLLITTFVESIYIDNDKIIINYKISMPGGSPSDEHFFVPNERSASAILFISTKFDIAAMDKGDVSDGTYLSV